MKPGGRLPARTLQDVRNGKDIPLRAPPRGSVVLFLSHGANCQQCRAYLNELAQADKAFRIWGGRLIGVVTDGSEAAAAAAPPSAGPRFSLTADPEQTLTGMLDSSAAALLVADRFGECFESFEHPEAESHAHDFLPDVAAVTDWLRFLGTQCPECGVPDTAV